MEKSVLGKRFLIGLAVALAVVLQTVYVNCLAGGSADEL